MYIDLPKEMRDKISVLEAEKYMPVMTTEELQEFEQIVIGEKQPLFSPTQLDKWCRLLSEREASINAKFAQANAKSKRVCKQKTAN